MSLPILDGLKLKYISFSEISKDWKGVSIWVGAKECALGSINEVYKKLSKYDDNILEYEIESVNKYFDILVIRLKEDRR